MSNTTIWLFVKFFTKEIHADQFIKGSLYLNRLSYYKALEDACDDGRPDRHEGVGIWWQPDNLIIKMKVHGFDETTITKADLAAPVSISFEHHANLHILCLYAVHTVSRHNIDLGMSLAENEAELQRQFRIYERCLKFGRSAVVVQAKPFLAQLKGALLRQEKASTQGLVEYYDDKTFNGRIPEEEIPFWKQKRFAYQQEFRVCVRIGTTGNDPLTIEIGDIGQFAAKIESSRLEEFKIKLSLRSQ